MFIVIIIFVVWIIWIPIYILKELVKDYKEKNWKNIAITVLSYIASLLFFNWLWG